MTGTTCTVADPVRDKRGRGAVIQTLRWGGGEWGSPESATGLDPPSFSFCRM